VLLFGFFRLGYNKFRSLNMELPMASSKAKAAPAIDLATKGCVPCKGGVPPIKGRELDGLIKHAGGWKAVSEHHITRTFTFPDFKTALEFTNRVGAIAEQQGHHPDIFLSWGKVEVTLYTHKIDGLTENDFILAARINKL
jgi:4a-hydroxytetrahydrobiopterin dehydratase